jgi:hypothetical protein
MRPNQFSLETAQKLAVRLKVPIEQIMHMPPHIIVQRLAEVEAKEKKEADAEKDVGDNMDQR